MAGFYKDPNDPYRPLDERRGIALVSRIGQQNARRLLDLYTARAQEDLDMHPSWDSSETALIRMGSRSRSKCHRLRLGLDFLVRDNSPEACRARLMARRQARREARLAQAA